MERNKNKKHKQMIITIVNLNSVRHLEIFVSRFCTKLNAPMEL